MSARRTGTPRVTVAAAANDFLTSRDLTPRSRTVYRYALDRLAIHVGDDRAVNQIQPRTIKAFMNRYYGSAAPATWNLNVAALRSFFAYCARQGFITKDPSSPIERRWLRRNPDEQVIPAADLDRLWARTDLPLREKALWRLLSDSAARSAEILALNIEDLDLDSKSGVVTGKGGERRNVNWYTQTAHLLRRLIGNRTQGPVFLADRQPRGPVPTADRDPLSGRARLSYRRAAQLFTDTTGWTLHQLRHTRIRQLKDEGCPLPILQKISGHRSLRTLTEHYPGPSPDAVRHWYTATDPSGRRRPPTP